MTSQLQGQVQSSRHSQIHLTPLVCIQDVQMNAWLHSNSTAVKANCESIVSTQYSEKAIQTPGISHIFVPGISERTVGGSSAAPLMENGERMWVV